MLKFFRKYNKIILVFGGTILMVLFLLPSGMNSLTGGGRGQTVARMDGRKISYADIQQAGAELELVVGVLDQSFPLLGIDPRDPALWLARTWEAERAGLVGGPADGRAFLLEAASFLFDYNLLVVQARFGPQNARQLLERRDQIIADVYAANQARLNAVVNSGRMTMEQAERALAGAYGVYRMVQASNPSGILSRPEALRIARNALDTATVGTVTIPAARIAADLPDPDESRILEHFEKFRSVNPADNPERMGYLQAPAVVIEYLTIDRQAISDRLVLDPIETNKFWRQNRARFPGEFADVRGSVEIAYRAQQVDRVMARAEEIMRREVFRSTEGLPGTSRKKELPENWASRMASFASLADIVEADLEKTFNLSGVPRDIARASDRSNWLDSSALASLPGIGQSVFPMTQADQFPFPGMVMATQELGGDERFGIQKGLIYGPLIGQSGERYYFRVLEVRPQGPPASVDAVREQVVRDIKLLEALDKLRNETDIFRERAVADGLSILAGTYGVSAQWGTTVTGDAVVPASGSFAETTSFDTPEFRDAVMGAARKLDPTVTELAADDPNRVVALVVPAARGLVVAQIQKWRPATVEQYRASATQIRSRSIERDPATNPLLNFSTAVVSERVGLKDVAGVIQSDEEPEPTEQIPPVDD